MAKLKSSVQILKETQRLYEVPNPIIGLTGGIGSGKSTVGKFLQAKGLIVVDADKLIHEIYQEQETINFLKKLAPQMIQNNEIDFPKLRELFFNSSLLKSGLENYLYQKLPLFFKSKLPKKKTTPIIYDVPLLFEKELNQQLDLSVVVSCSAEKQLERVLKRDNTDEATTLKIIENQLCMSEKVKRAHYNIINESDLEALKIETSKFFDSYFLA